MNQETYVNLELIVNELSSQVFKLNLRLTLSINSKWSYLTCEDLLLENYFLHHLLAS